ncbi:MAG TPA: bifunctional fructose-bisphosphatase/inositol-phosphate phosphatase [Methanocorpusculum sp.]|nr:bifunctional fructose-bisphosphatase/inositol-phosphate phosphatase [Methanocorpusculum sp.]
MLDGHSFLDICSAASAEVKKAVSPLIGTAYGSENIVMGADNTPTERLDKVAEDIILKIFSEKKVCKYILSEEAGLVDIGGDSGIAYLDPIDGSFNAGEGIPFYAVSIALSDGVDVIAGFVMNLANGETFTAVKGEGSKLNGKPIHVSNKSELRSSAMSIYCRTQEMKSMIIEKGIHVRRCRMLGASAIELSYVACGRLDGFLDLRGNLRVTDAAAGILICREAGGIVSLPDGSECVFKDDVKYGSKLLVANPEIHRIVTGLMG